MKKQIKPLPLGVDGSNHSSPEEAAIIASFKAADPAAMEAEYRELLEKRKRGELLPLEQVLHELGIDVREGKEPV